jgi:1-acyl-sn-glycerol-3-phosphate acyltransferase
MSAILAAFKFFLFFLICLMVVPPQLLILMVSKGSTAYVIPHIWHKAVCHIFQIRIKIKGIPNKNVQTLFVSNHLSYLDIPVIGSTLKASFVAKKDVASWPVFGFLSKLQQTAFIDRSRSAAIKEAGALGTMLQAGKSLILFPEGTSTDGRMILPFKSSLFSLALRDSDENLKIQPFTVSICLADGHPPKTQDERDLYAWHRDMTTELPAHLWRFAKTKGAEISLEFHAPLRAIEFSDRKILAKHCEDTVSKGLDPLRDAA